MSVVLSRRKTGFVAPGCNSRIKREETMCEVCGKARASHKVRNKEGKVLRYCNVCFMIHGVDELKEIDAPVAHLDRASVSC